MGPRESSPPPNALSTHLRTRGGPLTLADYTALLTLFPPSSVHIPPIRRQLSTLPGRIKAQQDTEQAEMLSKLKDLGNTFLGKFGLSTDNFKFDPQDGGGYSMRFER